MLLKHLKDSNLNDFYQVEKTQMIGEQKESYMVDSIKSLEILSGNRVRSQPFTTEGR